MLGPLGGWAALAATTVAVSGLGADPAHAARCKNASTEGGMAAVTRVTSVHKIRCAAALSLVERYGPNARTAFDEGGRFSLGSFKCRVTSVEYEGATATCKHKSSSFRLAYGS